MPKMSSEQYIGHLFQLAGYEVYTVRQHRRLIRRQGRVFWVNEGEDILKSDAIAVKENEKTLFIQVGTGYGQEAKAKAFRNVGLWTDNHREVLVIMKVIKGDKVEWRVFLVYKDTIRRTCIYDNVLNDEKR